MVFRAGQMRAHVSTAIRRGFERRWQRSRRQVERQFRPELAELDQSDRAELLAALDTALSLEAIEYLHTAHALPSASVRAVLIRTVRALLGDAGDGRKR
jgi:hypothetical protein